MTHAFRLPDVGEGVAEGEVVQWLVDVGDAVTEDQPIVEIETDKALVEIPSPVEGTVAELHAEEGEIVPVDDVLVTFDVEGEPPEGSTESSTGGAEAADETEPDAADAGASQTGETTAGGGRTFAPPSVRRLARELGVDVESVAGSGPSGRVAEADVRAAAEGSSSGAETDTAEAASGSAAPDEAAPADRESATAAGPDATTAGRSAADRERTLAAPATRRIARELGVDIDAVPATEEREGEAFVTEAAVRQFAEGEATAAETGAADVAARGASPADAAGERETTEPYRGIRRTIGEAMVESATEIPHVHSFETVEVSGLVEVRERLAPKAEEQGIDLTYMPLIVKSLAAALREYPELNATLDSEAEEIVYKHYCNVGIAVHTEAGLMVPVVEDVGEKGVLQLAAEIAELAERARAREIAREEMQGGTITVTNFGAVGGEFGTPIINRPETAIVGVGRIEERPVAVEGEVVARPTLPLSLGVDHRVIDGGVEAAFRNEFKRYLQDPTLLLLE